MKIETLVKRFNEEFGDPFLPGGLVKATIRKYEGEKYLNIKIGDRDVDYDIKTGEVTGAGTNVNAGVMWDIQKIKQDK